MPNAVDIFEKWFGIDPFELLMNSRNNLPEGFPDLTGMNEYEQADAIYNFLEDIEKEDTNDQN